MRMINLANPNAKACRVLWSRPFGPQRASRLDETLALSARGVSTTSKAVEEASANTLSLQPIPCRLHSEQLGVRNLRNQIP